MILRLFVLLAFFIATSTGAEEEKILNVFNWADYIGLTTIADFEAAAYSTAQSEFPDIQVGGCY